MNISIPRSYFNCLHFVNTGSYPPDSFFNVLHLISMFYEFPFYVY